MNISAKSKIKITFIILKFFFLEKDFRKKNEDFLKRKIYKKKIGKISFFITSIISYQAKVKLKKNFFFGINQLENICGPNTLKTKAFDEPINS